LLVIPATFSDRLLVISLTAARVDVGDIGVAELYLSSAPPMVDKWKTTQWMELADENGQHAGASAQVQLRWSPAGRRPETVGERARTPTVAAPLPPGLLVAPLPPRLSRPLSEPEPEPEREQEPAGAKALAE